MFKEYKYCIKSLLLLCFLFFCDTKTTSTSKLEKKPS